MAASRLFMLDRKRARLPAAVAEGRPSVAGGAARLGLALRHLHPAAGRGQGEEEGGPLRRQRVAPREGRAQELRGELVGIATVPDF